MKHRKYTRDGNKWGYNSVGDITGTLYSYLKRKAKERDLEFSVTKDYLWELFLNQNKKCALSGEELVISTIINKSNNIDRTNMNASLDRIDNTKGYIEGNVQWVHKTVNAMRRQYSIEEYVDWCKKIYNYNKEN